MNLEEYRHQIGLYYEFSRTISEILSKAINLSGAKIHHISCRAKDHESLRNKIQQKKYCENDQNKIEDFITDLAGCRIVFYHDSDINRFRNLGIIEANFDIDRKRSVELLPKTEEGSKAEDRYKGVHYIVGLKENRINLLEYSKFKGLWCEVQIHSALNNIFSQISHDITYKPNIGDKIGQDRLRSIDRMLCDIIDKHLMPARLAFENVKINHERLLSGKDLVDSNMIDEAKRGEITDNNELYTFLERYKAIIPDYNDVRELVNEAFEICKVSMEVARNNKSPTIINNWGNIRGKSYDEIVSLCLEILDILRYEIRVEDSISLLLECSPFQTKEIQNKIKKNLKKLSEYNIFLLRRRGYQKQKEIIDYINKNFGNKKKLENVDIIAEICGELLSCEATGDSATFDSWTFERAPLTISDDLKLIRSSAIKLLIELYDLINESEIVDKIEKNIKIIHALDCCFRNNSQPEKLDENYYKISMMILENSKEVVNFYIIKIAEKNYKLTQIIENYLARILHYGISKLDKEKPEDLSNNELNILIERFRDTAWLDEEYVIYRDLIGATDFVLTLKSYWGDSSLDSKGIIEKYIKLINVENFEVWIQRIFALIKKESHERLFNIHELLYHLAQTQPDLCLEALKSKSPDIEELNKNGLANNFISPILLGLILKKRDVVENLISDYIDKDLYLKECASILSRDNGDNFNLRERLLDKTIKTGKNTDEINDILLKFITNHSRSEVNKDSKNFTLKIIKELIKNHNHGWVAFCWLNNLIGKIIEDLNNLEDVDIILGALINMGEVSYEAEEVLARLAINYPDEVIDFFENRLIREKSKESDSYSAIPYELSNDKLKNELAKKIDKLFEIGKNNFVKDKGLFAYKWGRLIKIIFDDFPQNFVDKLIFFANGDSEDQIEFVLMVLNGLTELQDCKDVESLKKICKTIIKNPLYKEEIFFSNLFQIVTSTGVVMGKYGFAEALEKKIEEFKGWESDEDDGVRNFYKKFLKIAEEDSKRERAKADDFEELRKYEFEAS